MTREFGWLIRHRRVLRLLATHAATSDLKGTAIASTALTPAPTATVTITGTTAPGPDANAQAAQIAFSLGWQMVDLYREGLPRQTHSPALGPRLPGIGRLSPSQRALLRLDQVDAAVARLSRQILAGDLRVPTTKALRTLKEDPEAGAEQRRRAIYSLHVGLLRTLTAADFRLGKAYGLGRALADCCQTPADLDALAEHFGRYRLDVLRTWLNDSASYLPAHSAKAVLSGLTRWEAWVSNAEQLLQTPAAWVEDAELIAATLRRQGEMWRAVLSGEKNAQDMLTADSYQKAASTLVSRAFATAKPFLVKYAPALVLVIVAIAVLARVVFSSGTSQVVTTIASLATALGITWKTVGTTAERLGEALEKPLWGAELDAAVGEALTYLPLQPVAEPRPDLLLDTPQYLRAVDAAGSPAEMHRKLAGVGQRRLSRRLSAAATAFGSTPRATPTEVDYWLKWAVVARYVTVVSGEQPDDPHAGRYSLTPEGARIAAIPAGERGTVRAALGAGRTVVAADRPAPEPEPTNEEEHDG